MNAIDKAAVRDLATLATLAQRHPTSERELMGVADSIACRAGNNEPAAIVRLLDVAIRYTRRYFGV